MATQLDFRARVSEAAYRIIAARLTPLFNLFEQDGVTEVNLNGPDDVWITRYGKREKAEVCGVNEATAFSAARELAASMGQEADANSANCFVDAKMPGYRFSAILSPVAYRGTTMSIRKHSPVVLSLADYVEKGVMTQGVADTLSHAVTAGKNILIGGGTDSGKTTFLNALSREIPADERVGTIEDTRELSLAVPDWVPLEYNAQKGVTATMSLKALMRHSPHRIICGELRDEVAADWISSANTGHHGIMATVHTTSAALALERLEDLCLKADSNWPLLAIQRNIGRTIDLVVHFKKHKGRRLLNEIIEVHGFDPVAQTYRFTPLFNHQEPSA